MGKGDFITNGAEKQEVVISSVDLMDVRQNKAKKKKSTLEYSTSKLTSCDFAWDAFDSQFSVSPTYYGIQRGLQLNSEN